MFFCPKCKYEYNPGIEICPDCDEKLTDNLPREGTEEKNRRRGEDRIR